MKKMTSNQLIDPKIQKLRDELESNNAKIEQLRARNKGITEELRSRENTSIIGLVRGINMSPEQLAELLVHIGKKEDGSDPEEEVQYDPADGIGVPDMKEELPDETE